MKTAHSHLHPMEVVESKKEYCEYSGLQLTPAS